MSQGQFPGSTQAVASGHYASVGNTPSTPLPVYYAQAVYHPVAPTFYPATSQYVLQPLPWSAPH